MDKSTKSIFYVNYPAEKTAPARCYVAISHLAGNMDVWKSLDQLAKIALITVALMLFAVHVYLAIVSRLKGWPPPAKRFRPPD